MQQARFYSGRGVVGYMHVRFVFMSSLKTHLTLSSQDRKLLMTRERASHRCFPIGQNILQPCGIGTITDDS